MERTAADPVAWTELDEPPDDLPEILAGIERGRAAALTQGAPLPGGDWWAVDPHPDDERVYGLVSGDGGMGGAYLLQVFVKSLAEPPAPRWPTFPEWASLVDMACVRGTKVAPLYNAGMGFPLVGDKSALRPFLIVQVGSVGGTEADKRAALAARGVRSIG